MSYDETGDSTDRAGRCLQKLGSRQASTQEECACLGAQGQYECDDLDVPCEPLPFSPAYSSNENIAAVVLHSTPLCSSKVKHVFLVVVVAGLPLNSLEKAVSWSLGPPEPAFHTLPLPLYPQWGIRNTTWRP